MTKAKAAARAVHILGGTASPMVPELARVACASGISDSRQEQAMYALAGIGPAALDDFLLLASSESVLTRNLALHTLKHFGTNAQPAIPFLLRTLRATNDLAAAEAAGTLGDLTLQPGTVVPALVQALQRTNETLHIWALGALGDYGAQAKPAVPVLLAELRTQDWFVRQYVVMALKRIAPTALNSAAQ